MIDRARIHSTFAPLPAAVLLVAVLLVADPVQAAVPGAGTDTVTVAAGKRYEAGPVHRFVLGEHYRDLWTTPVRVPVLDLDAFAGGLEPKKRGGGMQTRSLRFRGADGREYTFRSVDKDPSPVLDPALHNTVVHDLVQDGISTAHPLGALVAAPLLEAAGVLHAEPTLHIMPDDEALGDFRRDFAGVLGIIEERPDENDGGETSFAGARKVIGSDRLMERIDEGTRDRVHAAAFLTARLMDVFLGDWDRHRDQWRWATYDDDGVRHWLPVPRDRDQAFSRFDGLAPRVMSLYRPQFVDFQGDYPSLVRLHWNGRALDRRFLSGLERAQWDSVGTRLQARLTDEVIDEAVSRLPAAMQQVGGEDLRRTLRLRRDRLPQAWNEFYELLAGEVDVHATDADDLATVHRAADGSVVVALHDADGDAPYMERRFHAAETDEVRLYLKRGADRVIVTGGESRVRVRLVGGPGDDHYLVNGGDDAVSVHDHEGADVVVGLDEAQVDRRPFEEWVWSEDDRDQPRDWGHRWTPVFWSSFSSDLGLFVGGGARWERYGFRASPFRTGVTVRGGFSPSTSKGRGEATVEWHQANSPLLATLELRGSGLDVIHYFGMGNDSRGGSEDFHKVDERQLSAAASVGVATASGLRLDVGFVVAGSDASDSNEGRYFAQLQDSLYGAQDFFQVGARARVDFRPHASEPDRSFRFRGRLAGTMYPSLGSVTSPYTAAEGEVAALFAPSSAVMVTAKAGGRRLWGRFPWREAAFLGGPENLPGWAEQRFAGDASAYVSGESRVRVLGPTRMVPADVGVFGFAAAGRVYLDGDSPGGWHTSGGGGVWLTPVGQSATFRAGVGVSEEATKLFASFGLPF